MRSGAAGKAVGILLGVVLGAGTALLAHRALVSRVESEAALEVESAAKRAVTLAESRISWVVRGLAELTDQAKSSCSPADLDAMRLTIFAVTPIKDLAVVDAEGRVLCTHLGEAVPIKRLTKELAAGSENVLIGLVQVGAHKDPMVWIRRPGPYGVRSLVALLPADLFIPQESESAGARLIRLRLVLSNGAAVGDNQKQVPESERERERISSRAESRRFGLVATASISRGALRAGEALLFELGALAMVVLGAILILFAIVLPRRSHNNPVDQMQLGIERNEFVPYYQPIIDISTGRLRGAEVLIRWRKADGSLVSPGNFIPFAESTGLIVELTRALMRRTCVECSAVLGPRPHLKLGFNLTARHFDDERIVSDAREIIGKSQLSPSQVVFEVTERQPLDDLTKARRVIAALQGLGCFVAIDDVGTGHGGLSYILKLGVDIIKIDKMFVDGIGTERYSTTIIEMLVELARNMRLDIVAEGVETFEQVTYLRERGISQAQGYVFAPPLPWTSFKKLVEAMDPATQEGAAETRISAAAVA